MPTETTNWKPGDPPGNTLPDDVWDRRKQEIEECVRQGASLTKAILEVVGYNANEYMSRRFPDWYESVYVTSHTLNLRKKMQDRGSKRQLYRDAARKKRLARKAELDAKVSAYFALKASGWSMVEIARAFGVSRQAVHQTFVLSLVNEEGEEDDADC